MNNTIDKISILDKWDNLRYEKRKYIYKPTVERFIGIVDNEEIVIEKYHRKDYTSYNLIYKGNTYNSYDFNRALNLELVQVFSFQSEHHRDGQVEIKALTQTFQRN